MGREMEMLNTHKPVLKSMPRLQDRIDLIDRYNSCLGQKNAVKSETQNKFISGNMSPSEANAYISLLEKIISKVCTKDGYLTDSNPP